MHRGSVIAGSGGSRGAKDHLGTVFIRVRAREFASTRRPRVVDRHSARAAARRARVIRTEGGEERPTAMRLGAPRDIAA